MSQEECKIWVWKTPVLPADFGIAPAPGGSGPTVIYFFMRYGRSWR